MAKEPLRIGMIMGKWVGGGVESVIMNYYRHIDRSKIQFDFICDEDSTNIPYEEIEKLGGKVILCPPYQKVFKYNKFLKKTFKENNYKIVHSNINTLSVFPLRAAKKAKVPIRIAHSHSVIINSKKEFKRNIMKNILRLFSKKYATNYFACSKAAAISLFGKKTFNNNEVVIIKNAIDIEKFSFNIETRNDLRKKLNIDSNDFVIGHVGRLVETKNQEYLIKIFKQINKKISNSFLILIGEGELKEKLLHLIKKEKLDNKIMLIGQVNDVEKYYQVMDLFAFPSLYEGLGMTVIEAQCSNIPCIVSTNVPNEVKINDNIEFIDLKEIDLWKSAIIKNSKKKSNRSGCKKEVSKCGYDIKNESIKLQKKYLEMIREQK